MKYWHITITKDKHSTIHEGMTFEQMNRKLKKECGVTIEYTDMDIKSNIK